MDIGGFDWLSGRVENWKLGTLTTEKPLRDHDRWDLQEDLVSVRFPGEVCLDVGWYPEHQWDGRFVVQIIADEDWYTPLFKCECTTIKDLVSAMSESIKLAHRVSCEKVANKGR